MSPASPRCSGRLPSDVREKAHAVIRNRGTGEREGPVTISMLAAFWAVSFLFVITPGVDWAYMISAGMRDRAVVPAVVGLLLGHLAVSAIVAAGVGGLVAGAPLASSMLTVAGAAYLLWLGISVIVRPPVPLAGEVRQFDSPSRWTLTGACVSGLNPKVFLPFLALLPQFTDPQGAWPVPAQIIVLGLVHVFSCGVIYLLVGFSVQAVLKTRPAAAKLVDRLSGGAMIVVAALLLTEQAIG